MNSFSWDGVFDISVTCLVGSVGSEKVLIFGFLFRPLVPCTYVFYIRDSLGKISFGYYLAGPFGILGIEYFLSFTNCKLDGITSKGASRV